VTNSPLCATESENFYVSLNTSHNICIPVSTIHLASCPVSAIAYRISWRSQKQIELLCLRLDSSTASWLKEKWFNWYVLFQMPCSREHHSLSSRLANWRGNSGCRTLRCVWILWECGKIQVLQNTQYKIMSSYPLQPFLSNQSLVSVCFVSDDDHYGSDWFGDISHHCRWVITILSV
jgi:hypothetical protein